MQRNGTDPKVSKDEIERVLHDLLEEYGGQMSATMDEIIEDTITDHISRVTVSEWAEEHRILPADLSSLPGPYRFAATPYLREIADCFSENSAVQKVAIMKGTQLGLTVGVLENWMGYTIDVAPGPMLFISGDRQMAETSMQLRVDRLIESAGLADRIFAQSTKKNSRDTGNTKSRKDFPGGFIAAAGPNTGSKLRTLSIRYLGFDEVDAYPAETGAEGDPVALAERRTDSYERTRKILYISTPLVEQSSKIKPLYEKGDQRRYFVPCKHCGEPQTLEWEHLKYDTDDESGRLLWDSVRYECPHCRGEMTNDDKAYFLPRGEWRPTAEPSEPGFRSYHLSALYSPVGFRTWESICNQWLQVGNDTALRRNFKNTVLGETFLEKGEAPEIYRVIANTRSADFYTGEILPGALFLTVGADVQKDRIEAELVAWGRDKESWSVDYRIFDGDTSTPNSKPWRDLEAWIREPRAKEILRVLVDAGYRTNAVYAFCERFPRIVAPVMGKSGLSSQPFRKFGVKGYRIQRIDMQVDPLKSELYDYLRLGAPEPGEPVPVGFCHFPQDRTDRYFDQLISEELVIERKRSGRKAYRWVKVRERNEALDCRVYALGALSVLKQEVGEFLGVDQEQERGLDWGRFWDYVEKKTREREAVGSG